LADHAKQAEVHQQAMAMANLLTQLQQVVNIEEIKCQLTSR
jgi:hypothetical protein